MEERTVETLDIEQAASYLCRDVREVGKLASRGHIPCKKVGGQYRFLRTEINAWLETQLPLLSEKQLSALEAPAGQQAEEPLLAGLMSEATCGVPLPATTRSSVLKELVSLAEQTWQVYDPAAVLAAVRQREAEASTSQPGGVAIPHPHRPLPAALGESVVAFGRTVSAIPFGGPRGALTDLFFLVCCRDDRTHLQVLARLARLFLRPGFLDELRAAETPADAYDRIKAAEEQLLET